MYTSLHQGHAHKPVQPNQGSQELNYQQNSKPLIHMLKPGVPYFSSLLFEGQLSVKHKKADQLHFK